jgi:hypothetical protein
VGGGDFRVRQTRPSGTILSHSLVMRRINVLVSRVRYTVSLVYPSPGMHVAVSVFSLPPPPWLPPQPARSVLEACEPRDTETATRASTVSNRPIGRMQAREAETPVHRYHGFRASMRSLSHNAAVLFPPPACAAHALELAHATTGIHRYRVIGPTMPPKGCLLPRPPVYRYPDYLTWHLENGPLWPHFSTGKTVADVAPSQDLWTWLPIPRFPPHPCCPVFSRKTQAIAYRSPGIPVPL